MKYLLVIKLIAFLLFAHTAQSQGSLEASDLKKFNGLYLGVNLGSQNVFGGSFVNDMDILAQESKFVTELQFGYKVQFLKNRIVLGMEYSFGFLNGNLEHTDPTEPLRISYKNSNQNSIGLILGTTIGTNRKTLIYAYINETKRKFVVDINQPPHEFRQKDKQGMFKYGLGIEYKLNSKFGLKSSIGALRVDFGTLATNIDVEDLYDFMIGMTYQLKEKK